MRSHLAITEDLWSHLDTRKHSILNHSDMPYIEMGYDSLTAPEPSLFGVKGRLQRRAERALEYTGLAADAGPQDTWPQTQA